MKASFRTSPIQRIDEPNAEIGSVATLPTNREGFDRWIAIDGFLTFPMSLTTFGDDDVDYGDETPFLQDDAQDPSLRKQTPLPIKQISLLLLPGIAESIVDHSINPYLNQVRMSAAATWNSATTL